MNLSRIKNFFSRITVLSPRLKAALDRIDRVAKEFDEAGIYLRLRAGEADYFHNWCLRLWGRMPIDSAYVKILSQIDGFEMDGLLLYSLDRQKDENIYDNNEIWWEVDEDREYLYLGEDDLSWYCVQIATNKPCLLDKPSGTMISVYDSFEELLLEALDGICRDDE